MSRASSLRLEAERCRARARDAVRLCQWAQARALRSRAASLDWRAWHLEQNRDVA